MREVRSRSLLAAAGLLGTALFLSACLQPQAKLTGTLGQSVADDYWNKVLPDGENTGSGDCTNYISWVLHHATPSVAFDRPYTDQDESSTPFSWWLKDNNINDTKGHSETWAEADGFFNWFTTTLGVSGELPNVQKFKETQGKYYSYGLTGHGFTNAVPAIIPNGSQGAVVFFVWDWQVTNYPKAGWDGMFYQLSHSAIEVYADTKVNHSGSPGSNNPTYSGTVPSKGSVVDTHSVNLHHEFWSLIYFNVDWAKTVFEPVTIKYK